MAKKSKSKRPPHPSWPALLAALAGAGMVFAVALGYDSSVYALYFTPRVVILYPLACLFLGLAVLATRPGLRVVRLDWLDLVALSFVIWQLVSVAFSPSPTLAWYGILNRGGGAILWITAALLFVAGRRVLGSPLALRVFAFGAGIALLLAGWSALVQLSGGQSPWGSVEVFLEQGRMTGTTGNPVNLAGLSLLGLFVGGLALTHGDFRRPVRVALAVLALFGLCAMVLSVSRAGYIGWAVGLVSLAGACLVLRDWRKAIAVLLLAAVMGALYFGYNPRLEQASRVDSQANVGTEQSDGVQNTEGGLSESDQSRLEFWRIGLKALEAKPVTGYGQGTYVIAYRAFVSQDTIARKPNVAVSDPHQVLLLLAAGSGAPGLLLGLVLWLGTLALLLFRFRQSGQSGVLAGIAYLLGALAFLQVSPVDPVVLIPLMLALGALVGEPKGEGKPSIKLRPSLCVPAFPGGRVLCGLLVAAAFGAFVCALVLGIGFYRAEVAFGESMRTGDPALAVRAHRLAPKVPEYAQVAGGLLWRRGFSEDRTELVDEGDALLQDGLRVDPTAVAIWAERARLFSATKRPQEAVEACRNGLRYSPHHPILQGLWGNAAVIAAQDLRDPKLGRKIAEELLALPVDSPDGWYWLASAWRVLGDSEAAEKAKAKAAELAPNLTDADYQRRGQTGQ